MSGSRPEAGESIPATWTWAARDRYYRDLPGPRPNPRVVRMVGIVLFLTALAVVPLASALGHPFFR